MKQKTNNQGEWEAYKRCDIPLMEIIGIREERNEQKK